jgi:alcohol oxidase
MSLLSYYLIFFYSDCSIGPANVGANTYNNAIAIGEKAAVIIAEDLGIKGVTSE